MHLDRLNNFRARILENVALNVCICMHIAKLILILKIFWTPNNSYNKGCEANSVLFQVRFCMWVQQCDRRSGVTELMDRRTDRQAAGWRQQPHACHDTPHANRLHTAAPTLRYTMSAQCPASRTSGSSNVKYSHGDKRCRDSQSKLGGTI